MMIVHKINTDVAEILRTQEMVEFLAKHGAEPFVTTPDEFRTILRSDIDKWAKVVKAADVKLN